MLPPYHRLEEFVPLTPEEIRIAEGWTSSKRSVKRHHIIRREGDQVAGVFFLLKGWVGSSVMLRDGRRQIVKVHLPGDMLGFPSLSLVHAGETLEALTDAIICPIPNAAIGKLLMENPRLATGLFLSTQKERVALMQKLSWLGATSALERMVAFLLDLYDRANLSGLAKENRFEVPLTQQQLGELLGLTAVHVNRTLKRLDSSGLLERRKAVVRLIDVEGLQKMTANIPPRFAHHDAWVRLGSPSSGA